MHVVRLCTRRHPEIDGEGAKRLGGRWNSPGRAVVYAASCGALAALEYIVHAEELPVGLLLLRVEVPDTLKIDEVKWLPADPEAIRQIGDEWLEHNETAIMRVPSVLAPSQWNLLINPAHLLFPTIQVVEETPFVFDKRLVKALPVRNYLR